MHSSDNYAAVAAEAQRQQQFFTAPWSDSNPSLELLNFNLAACESGLSIYRINGFAVAERTLSSSFPTVQAILGDEGFAVLCKHFR